MTTKTEEPRVGTIAHRALHRNILVVARLRYEGRWKAYIFPVPGQCHADEIYLWETEGNQLTEEEASAIFPAISEKYPYAQ